MEIWKLEFKALDGLLVLLCYVMWKNALEKEQESNDSCMYFNKGNKKKKIFKFPFQLTSVAIPI